MTTSNGSIRKIALVALVILLAMFLTAFATYQYRHSDPYIQDVLGLPGNVAHGRFIFEMNCSSCHGLYGDGQVGPSLRHVSDRRSRVGLIKQVISGKTPPMPQFQPTPQEMADLLKYLQAL